MLTDTAIKALRSQHKLYKVSDRDGMYVVVQPSGAIVFRYDYRLNGRRETLTLGRYGPDGLSLARAREKLIDAKRAISEGRSPAQERPRWSCLSWSLMFDGPRTAQPHVRAWSTLDGICARDMAPSVEPGFDLCQVPDDAARGEIKALREFSSLLHVVDRAVGKRHDLS